MTLKWLGEHIETIKIRTEDVCCGNCQHFYQHYVQAKYGTVAQYVPTNCGHCAHPRIKDRRVDQKCDRFTPKKASELIVEGDTYGRKEN